MKKLIFMLSAVIFLFTACEKEVDSTDPTSATPESGFHKVAYTGLCDDSFSTPMIAGGGSYDEDCGGIEVGTITVLRTDNDNGTCTYNVTYDITEPGWWIDLTHLYVGPLYAENGKPAIPVNKKGNPKIGHFNTVMHGPPGVDEYTYDPITLDCDPGNIVISAHANVRNGDEYPVPYTVEDFCDSLPDEVTLNIGINFWDSYLNIWVTDDDWLDGGPYPGWCIDVDEPIDPRDNPFENTAVYCLDEADDVVDKHGNLHMVAWLINQHYVHEPSACNGNYTYADVQYAIWLLVDDYVPEPDDVAHLGAIFVEDLEPCRAEEIYNAAVAYAAVNDPFEPGCGDLTVVVFDPGVGIQKVIIEFQLECDQEETAWGYGYYTVPEGEEDEQMTCADGAEGRSFTNEFGASAWGWFFYGCQEPPPED